MTGYFEASRQSCHREAGAVRRRGDLVAHEVLLPFEIASSRPLLAMTK
jgi:hypothetical protein